MTLVLPPLPRRPGARRRRRRQLVLVALASVGGVLAATSARAVSGATRGTGATETLVRTERLPNVPGQTLTAVRVAYAPGGTSPRHRHAGSVLAVVLSGAVRSENSATGPARVYRAGESFFEPAGSVHTVSANASTTEPAELLAIFVAPDGATLTEGER